MLNAIFSVYAFAHSVFITLPLFLQMTISGAMISALYMCINQTGSLLSRYYWHRTKLFSIVISENEKVVGLCGYLAEVIRKTGNIYGVKWSVNQSGSACLVPEQTYKAQVDGKWITAFVTKREQATLETIILTVQGGDFTFIERLLETSEQWLKELRKQHRSCYLYTSNSIGNSYICSEERISMDYTYLSKEAKAIVKEIDYFLSSDCIKLCKERGFHHRRGYLLHGPPGTGKSSFVKMLCQAFGIDLYIVDLRSITPAILMQLFSAKTSSTPRVLLFEEIDLVCPSRSESKACSESRCALSDLLQAIDGPLTGSGFIIMATTNSMASLDSALIRKGRFDRHVYFGNLSRQQASGIVARVFAIDKKTAREHMQVHYVNESMSLGDFMALCYQYHSDLSTFLARLRT